MNSELLSRLGVQSFTLRGFKEHDKVIDILSEMSLKHIELSSRHFRPETLAEAEKTINKYRDHGICIIGFAGFGSPEAEDEARFFFDIARLAGYENVNMNVPNDGVAMFEKLCDEYGMKAVIHNHGRKHKFGSVRAIRELFNRTSPNVGLLLDTGWMLDAGEDPVEVAKMFKNRLYGVHLKDFVFDQLGKASDVVVGTGNLDLDALLAYLVETDYQGTLSIEYEGDVDNPVPALKACVEQVGESFKRIS